VSDNKFQGESHTCVCIFATTFLHICYNIFTFAGELPKELGKLINLTHLNVAWNSIGGELYIPTYMRVVLLLLFELARVPGRVPKELADLTKLTTLYLHPGNTDLQVPDGAPTDSDGDMYYDDRKKVAAFQACLK